MCEISKAQGIEITDADTTTQLPLDDVVKHAVLEGRDDMTVLCLVQQEGAQYVLHALNADQSAIELLKVKLSLLVVSAASAQPAASAEQEGAPKFARTSTDGGTGSSFTQSLRKIQRKRTVNLKGSGGGGFKVRSEAYGNTFSSLGGAAPPPPPVAAVPNLNAGMMHTNASLAMDDDLEDDDLLAGVEEDMFATLDN